METKSIKHIDCQGTKVKLVLLEEVDSTNNFIKTNIENLSVVSTLYQSKGRGQLDKKWQSEKGKNILMSLCIEDNDYSPLTLNFSTTLSIVEFLEKYGIKSQIKWINDIFINKNKISGILIEKLKNHFIIGIGLNINQIDFSNQPFTSLAKETKTAYNLQECLEKLVVLLIKNITLSKKSEVVIKQDYFEKLIGFAQNTNMLVENQEIEGKIIDITSESKVVIDIKGKIKEYLPNQVKI